MRPVGLPDPASVRRVAVRLTNWVGDCVMNTPFLGRVRELFPAAHVTVLGRKSVVPLLQPHPWVDAVCAIDDQSTKGFLRAVSLVREIDADLGFLLPNSLKAAALFATAGVRCRVGYDRDVRRALLTHPVELRPEDLAVHEVRYYLRLLHFWETEDRAPKPLCLTASPEEDARVATLLAAEGIGPEHFVVGVNPAAFFGTAKRWPAERYAAVARHLRDVHGARVVVTGLPKERDVAQAVCDAGGEGFFNAAGRMTLRELVAFLRRTNLFLTNDSGAMHIAAAFGTPLVAVFGSTDWVTTAPLSPWARIVRVETPCAPCLLRDCPIDHRCMKDVRVPMVIDAVEALLRDVRATSESHTARPA